MRTIYLLLLALLLCASFAAAGNAVAEVKPIKDTVTSGESATFQIRVTNTGPTGDFRLYYTGIEWDITPQTFRLQQQQSTTITVIARPLYVQPGQHVLTVNIRSQETNAVDRATLIVNVRKSELSSYTPSVGLSVGMPESLIPQEDLTMDITLMNKNPLPLGNVTLHVDSDYFSREAPAYLGPTNKENVGEQSLRLTIDLEDTIRPQSIPLSFSVVWENKTILSQQRTIEILSHNPGFVTQEDVDARWFKTTTLYTVQNGGNVRKSDVFKLNVPLFREYFTSTTPDAGILKEEGSRYLFWELELDPAEKEVIEVTVNYRPFVLFLILLIGVIVIYFVIRSPLRISKKAEIIQTQEGGISMLKVQLILRNISEKPVSEVQLYDRIPHLADYFREDMLGTLSPTKVWKHDKKGTLMRWDIPVLEGFEERMITYKIRSQLNILGGITLPPAQAKFLTKSRRKRDVSGSAFTLSIEKGKN